VGLVDDGGVEQCRDAERHRERLLVDTGRRLVVLLDQTGGVVGQILEDAVDATLLLGGLVEFTEFAPGGMKLPGDGVATLGRLAEFCWRIAEQLRLVSSCWWISRPATRPSSS